MNHGNSGASPSDLNSNFVCFWSILPDPLVPVNSHFLRKLFSSGSRAGCLFRVSTP
jgi:hypothetical protein